jgi:hypothetical protein
VILALRMILNTRDIEHRNFLHLVCTAHFVHSYVNAQFGIFQRMIISTQEKGLCFMIYIN